MDAALDYYSNPNYIYSSFPNDSINYETVSEGISAQNTTHSQRGESAGDYAVIAITILALCISGAVGNGAVIWFLGFRIKRNPFSTYILNLAIADLGVLLSGAFIIVNSWILPLYGFSTSELSPAVLFLSFSTYSASQFLRMAICIDRCVAAFFPLWHRCHQLPHLSTVVCSLIWFLSFLLTSVYCTLVENFEGTVIEETFPVFVDALLCLPIMTLATVALFIKVCLKSRQQRRGKLLTIVLLTFLFFLLFAFPVIVMLMLYSFKYLSLYAFHIAFLLVCLNSSVNPAIYILVGRQWNSRQRENMKMIFQKVFKEEDGHVEENPVETQL